MKIRLSVDEVKRAVADHLNRGDTPFITFENHCLFRPAHVVHIGANGYSADLDAAYREYRTAAAAKERANRAAADAATRRQDVEAYIRMNQDWARTQVGPPGFVELVKLTLTAAEESADKLKFLAEQMYVRGFRIGAAAVTSVYRVEKRGDAELPAEPPAVKRKCGRRPGSGGEAAKRATLKGWETRRNQKAAREAAEKLKERTAKL